MNNTNINITVTRICRAKDGSLYFKLESDRYIVWISQTELLNNEKETIIRIAEQLSVKIVTTQVKNKLKDLIQNSTVNQIEESFVATQQGYLTPEVYVHANGDITQSSKNTVQPIAVFPLDDCGGTMGSFLKWKRGISKSIFGNKDATFMLCFGFCPMILYLVSPTVLNPFLEIIGRKLNGKSTLAAMVASIYGGDPQSDIGYGFNWNSTEGAFTELKRSAAHSLLYLDENNIQGEKLRQNGKIAFLQSSTDDRKRMGDTRRKQPVRMALLSTGNKMPEQATASNKNEVDAAKSRIISLYFNDNILNECPPDFESTKEASRVLRSHINEHYGHASRKFIQRVVDLNAKDPEEIKAKIEKHMKYFYGRAEAFPDVDDRIIDTIALTYAAGQLANNWNILPKGCSKVIDASMSVLKKVSEQNTLNHTPELGLIKSILSKYEDQIKTFEKDDRPKKKHNPKNLFGCRVQVTDDISHYYLHPQKLRHELGTDATTTLKELRDAGFLQGQNGQHSKLVYPSPKYVPFSSATYKLIIPE
jgi:hypothetical protein